MTPKQAKPNFLLIVTDQHRADHLGCYGNSIVKTPHLDALASEGWRAEKMYVATPICMPNRASLLTGRYPSAHGARYNGVPLSTEVTTFVDLLAESGYTTSLIGKAHFQNMTSYPAKWPVEDVDRLPHEARRAPRGRYDQERSDLWLGRNDFELDYPFYGFQKVDLVDGHSDTVHGHYRYWLRKNRPDAEALLGSQSAIETPDYTLSSFGQAWRTRVPEDVYPTAYIADRAKEQLEEFAESSQPFLMTVCFPDPHHPFTPPGKYWDMYSPDDVRLSPSFNCEHNLAPHVDWLKQRREMGLDVKNATGAFACSEREAREAVALNYGSITNIDDKIGQVLRKLRDLDLEKNTVVIFTSDHGDFLGDHGLLLKGPIHYQGLVRVPFIWRDPSTPSAKGSGPALVSTIDIGPTILDRAGIPRFNGMQGRGMLRLMEGDSTGARQHLMIEEEGQRVYLGFESRVRCRSIVDARYRLTIYDGVSWAELYDLEQDPLEAHNCWHDVGYADVRSAMLESLARLMLEHVDISPYPSALA
jgi:arylsulfatase A-like enzyme